MYMNNTSIPPIIFMNRVYDNQNLLYIAPFHITELGHCLIISFVWFEAISADQIRDKCWIHFFLSIKHQ